MLWAAPSPPAIHSTVQTEPRRVININSNDMSMYSQFDERCLCAERWLRGGKEATQSLPFRTAIGTPPVVQIAGINVGLLLASLVSLWGAVLWRPARGFTSQASGAPLVNTPRRQALRLSPGRFVTHRTRFSVQRRIIIIGPHM